MIETFSSLYTGRLGNRKINIINLGYFLFRQGLSVCVLGGKLFDNNNSSSNDDRRVFAIGGHDGWNYLNSVEAINVNELQGKAKGGWVSAKSMKSTRANSGCAVIGKMLVGRFKFTRRPFISTRSDFT